jgi:RNA polymerase sigma-70 factor (ECF subfamily)
MSDANIDWSGLMRAANSGNTDAYHELLRHLVPFVRKIVVRSRARICAMDPEDLVQETLLAVHAYRHTWDEKRPVLPWVKAIARNKITDTLRRNRVSGVPIDDLADTLATEPAAECHALDANRILALLKGRKREIVAAISLEDASIRQVAQRFGMSEGAVRVAFHRSLRALARAVSAS